MRIDRHGIERIDVSVIPLRGGNPIDDLVSVRFEFRVRVIPQRVRSAFDNLVDIRIVEVRSSEWAVDLSSSLLEIL